MTEPTLLEDMKAAADHHRACGEALGLELMKTKTGAPLIVLPRAVLERAMAVHAASAGLFDEIANLAKEGATL